MRSAILLIASALIGCSQGRIEGETRLLVVDAQGNETPTHDTSWIRVVPTDDRVPSTKNKKSGIHPVGPFSIDVPPGGYDVEIALVTSSFTHSVVVRARESSSIGVVEFRVLGTAAPITTGVRGRVGHLRTIPACPTCQGGKAVYEPLRPVIIYAKKDGFEGSVSSAWDGTYSFALPSGSYDLHTSRLPEKTWKVDVRHGAVTNLDLIL